MSQSQEGFRPIPHIIWPLTWSTLHWHLSGRNVFQNVVHNSVQMCWVSGTCHSTDVFSVCLVFARWAKMYWTLIRKSIGYFFSILGVNWPIIGAILTSLICKISDNKWYSCLTLQSCSQQNWTLLCVLQVLIALRCICLKNTCLCAYVRISVFLVLDLDVESTDI